MKLGGRALSFLSLKVIADDSVVKHACTYALIITMPFLQRKLWLYTATTLSALSCLLIPHRATAQSLPPAAQVGNLGAHEICVAIADGRLDDQATDAAFEMVLQQVFERVESLYGPETSAVLFSRLDTVFKSPGPPLDPYFMEISQNFLRFVTTDTSCYNSLYTLIATPTQAPAPPPVTTPPDALPLSPESELKPQ